MFCFNCSTQDKKGSLAAERNKEAAYITKGFKSWKKAPKCFEEHQESKCHKIATIYHVVVPKCKDIAELTKENLSVERAKERRYLLDVIRGLRYLGRQGIALQGHSGEDNFTQLMILLGAKDKNIRDHLNKSLGNKYTSDLFK